MEMKYNHYALFDKVSGHVVNTFIATNDGVAVRDTLLSLRVPIRDSEIYQIGTFTQDFDTSKGTLSELSSHLFNVSCDFDVLDVPRLVSWDSYKFPENVAEAIAPLGCTPDEVREITKNRIKEGK